jgi:hypothetical protein
MPHITRWNPGQRVEARHPTYHRAWGLATVEDQHEAYVKVAFDDGLRRPADGGPLVGGDHAIQTYHLNVRKPGAPDPVRQLQQRAGEFRAPRPA